MRKIIHLDLDAFFCAVEELRSPELVGRPFAVGGRPDARGVISSCSYAARAFGVRSAMPTARALRLCPELILIPGRHRDYSAASRQVMAVLRNYTPIIEQVSIDEAFLDVSDLPTPGEELARDMQAAIAKETGLPCSLGVATNKLVAKMANDFGKSRHRGTTPPRSIMVVPPGEERSFLAPLPVQALWGIGPKYAQKLESLGIHTIGDLAQTSERYLHAKFGKYGREIWLHAQGIDDRPVETEHSIKSISQEVTFERDVRSRQELHRMLRRLSGQVAYRLRKEKVTASTVRIKVRWPDFSLQTRQVTLSHPTDIDQVISLAALELFDQLWDGVRPVRLIGVGASGLAPCVYQPSLFDRATDRERQLVQAIDTLRARFGEQVVRRADELKPARRNRRDR